MRERACAYNDEACILTCVLQLPLLFKCLHMVLWPVGVLHAIVGIDYQFTGNVSKTEFFSCLRSAYGTE